MKHVWLGKQSYSLSNSNRLKTFENKCSTLKMPIYSTLLIQYSQNARLMTEKSSRP